MGENTSVTVSQFFVRNYPFSLRILVLSITKIVVGFFSYETVFLPLNRFQ